MTHISARLRRILHPEAVTALTPPSIGGSREETIAYFKAELGQSDDFAVRPFIVFGSRPAVLFYFFNMIDQEIVNTQILKALMTAPPRLDGEGCPEEELKSVLIQEALYHSECRWEADYQKVSAAVLRGDSVVAIEGISEALVIGTRKIDKRSVDQPATEQVIRGPREGFIEPLGTNIALLRYRLQTKTLRIRTMEIGERTHSKVALCYLEDIADPALVEEVEKRLSNIKADAILDSGYLEQYIEDNNISPFPQIQYTERPDKVAANLLEGRVSILVDGSPLALLVPIVFNQFYQTVEDYTERFLLMSAIRLARAIALVFSLIFPSLYVAIISYNPELIPTEFAVAVAGGRAGVPFPAIIEVLVIEISMEVLREATIRLPQQVGGALSIVGVLVIGQAAVSAGFASPITVVIIALTTIGSFATPAYNAALALRLLRFPLIIMASIFGLYGIMVGLILIVNHMLSLKSFGIPYLSPVVPGNVSGMMDVLFRTPIWSMKKRPSFLNPRDPDRVNRETVEQLRKPPTNVLDPKNLNPNDKESAK
ncbi:spore germination protein [Cohnella candidum]|uniref:Spore germination protein n=1 Tax=Cohnella candidum TaxID=2674991 RepID=A0A3G3JWF5_9BACL|nr:spore germination protein [Cohnella candidum]AYQ72572.1 spore germination protein [Cohnella candidum]